MFTDLVQQSIHRTSAPELSIGLTPLVVIAALLFIAVARHTKQGGKLAKASLNDEDDLLGLSGITPFQGSPLDQKPDWPRYWKPGTFQMTMALRRIDINNWFKMDELYDSEHAAKVAMANAPNSEDYVDYIDGVEDEAVVELLGIVVTYLVRRYPAMFQTDGHYVYIPHLKEKYRIRSPFDYHPLAIVGLLVMDDVYVLKKDPGDQYTLYVGAFSLVSFGSRLTKNIRRRGVFLACPSGWRLQQRLGWRLHQIHDAVPILREKLRKSMDRFFFNLKPSSAIMRNNLFIQPTGRIFHIEPFENKPKCTSIEQVHIRTEQQSLTRLPRSQANVFTVRTYLVPMTDLKSEPEQLEALWDHVRNFPDSIAAYKCRHLWGDVFEEFCRDVLGKSDPYLTTTGDAEASKERPNGATSMDKVVP